MAETEDGHTDRGQHLCCLASPTLRGGGGGGGGGGQRLKTDTQTDRDQHKSLSSITHPEREGRRAGRRRADGGANTWGRAPTGAGWTGSSHRPPAPPADSPGTTRSWTRAPPTPGSCCTSCHGRWLKHGKTQPSVEGRQAARSETQVQISFAIT